MSPILRGIAGLGCLLLTTPGQAFFPAEPRQAAFVRVASAASTAPVERLRTIPEDARKGVMWPPQGRRVRINDSVMVLAPGATIRDMNNRTYNILEESGLASLDLHGQGAVDIYTKAGDSNPIELYLGLSDPIWQPGETVRLLDPTGEVHDTYIIP